MITLSWCYQECYKNNCLPKKNNIMSYTRFIGQSGCVMILNFNILFIVKTILI